MTGDERPVSRAGVANLELHEVRQAADFAAAIAIRATVFIDEQHLTDVVDRDPYDHGPDAVVILARLDGVPVATGRVHVWRGEGQIAWVAVLPEHRGAGVGWEVMVALLDAAERHGATRVTLSAQTHALGFYRRLGFEPVGSTFIMGDIEHITMVRDLGE